MGSQPRQNYSNIKNESMYRNNTNPNQKKRIPAVQSNNTKNKNETKNIINNKEINVPQKNKDNTQPINNNIKAANYSGTIKTAENSQIKVNTKNGNMQSVQNKMNPPPRMTTNQTQERRQPSNPVVKPQVNQINGTTPNPTTTNTFNHTEKGNDYAEKVQSNNTKNKNEIKNIISNKKVTQKNKGLFG